MRSVRSELLSVAAVLALPIGIASVFPYGAIGFSASRSAAVPDARTASIVFLGEEDVARVIRAARTVTRGEDAGRSYVDLLPAELPGADASPTAAIGLRRKPDDPPLVESGISPFLPSRRAFAPVRIPAETAKEEPVFSRDELLKLN